MTTSSPLHHRSPWALALVLGSSVAIASTPAAATSPGSATSAPESASAAVAPEASSSLRITVDPSIADASLMPSWILARHPRPSTLVPEVDGHEQWISVEIAGKTYDYSVSVMAMRDGEPVGTVAEPKPCQCNNEALLELVDQEIAAASEQLRTSPPVPPEPEPPAVTPEPEPETDAPAQQTETEPEGRRRISGLGIAGGAIGGAGVAALGAGIAMLVVEPKPIRDRSSLVRDWRPTGAALLGVGSAALVAGVSMLVVDVVRCRKQDAPRPCMRRSEGSTRSVHLGVAPAIWPRSTGIAIMGRF